MGCRGAAVGRQRSSVEERAGGSRYGRQTTERRVCVLAGWVTGSTRAVEGMEALPGKAVGPASSAASVRPRSRLPES